MSHSKTGNCSALCPATEKDASRIQLARAEVHLSGMALATGDLDYVFPTAANALLIKHRSNNNCRSYARQSVEIRRLATAATTRSDTYSSNDAKSSFENSGVDHNPKRMRGAASYLAYASGY
jgi:hypothetical protein